MLFEVPTGVFADRFGRKASVVISYVVIGTAMVLFGALGSAPLIIAAYALWGLGYTFMSGALEAWLADEVGTERLARVILRGAQAGWAGALLGVGASAAIGFVDLRGAIVAGGLGAWAIAVGLAAFMPETGFTRPSRTGGPQGLPAFAHAARDGARIVRGNHALLLMFVIALVFGLWTESFDRLWAAHVLTSIELPRSLDLGDVGWISLLTAVAFGLGVAATEVGVRRFEHSDNRGLARALLGLNALLLAAALAFALAGQAWLALGAFVLLTATRSLVAPLSSVWVNRTIEDPSRRATILSIVNQADAFGQVAGGPAIGVLATRISLRAGLAAGTIALVPALWLYGRALRRPEYDV